jgi:hypothetical protein
MRGRKSARSPSTTRCRRATATSSPRRPARLVPVVLPLLHGPAHAGRRPPSDQALEGDPPPRSASREKLRAGRTHLPQAPAPGAAALGLQAASCTYRIALGPRAGQKVLSLQSVPSADRPSAPELCTKLHGFSLHAACAGARSAQGLEHLCRYITRPAIANERLKRNRAGDVVLQLKSAFMDGTPISSLRRWNSCSASPPWCPVRAYI